MGSEEKDVLELRKLGLEIAEMERPWWKRPTYILAALPTLLAVLALSVGFLNGFFSAQMTKLDNEKHDVEAQIKQFEGTRNDLVSQNDKLQKEVIESQRKLGDITRIVARLRGAELELEMREQNNKPDAEMQRIQKELDAIDSDLVKIEQQELKSATHY
jgi:hypothetical protein